VTSGRCVSAAKQNPHRPGIAPALGLRAGGDGLPMIPRTTVRAKGSSVMEPRKTERPAEPRGEGPTSPPRQPERKRRFRIIKLEERIAPAGGHGHGGLRGNHNEILVRDVPRRR
jgi:hypothetical protein